MIELIEKLENTYSLTEKEYTLLIQNRTPELARELSRRAVAQRQKYYGKTVYVRGLIEFTNYCKNDCYYCGLRRSNSRVQRYRLSQTEILECCREGYELGYRTFVLQGGEDPWYTPDRIAELVHRIKTQHPDCAVTLSVGEQPRQVYEQWFTAGAERYLLRHETADEGLYGSLHPVSQSLQNRLDCLKELKDIGYQVGCGFMVGSPGQIPEHLAKDLKLVETFAPHMVGIGPFIPQKDTPFGQCPAGSVELTLFLLSLIRLMHPKVLLPSTTALGTLHPQGRELGILAGANVCMPNLSPKAVREKYALYDDKICTGDEAAESLAGLKQRIEAIGYEIVIDRGDHIGKKETHV